jgi:hypothetical protein
LVSQASTADLQARQVSRQPEKALPVEQRELNLARQLGLPM